VRPQYLRFWVKTGTPEEEIGDDLVPEQGRLAHARFTEYGKVPHASCCAEFDCLRLISFQCAEKDVHERAEVNDALNYMVNVEFVELELISNGVKTAWGKSSPQICLRLFHS
jgi:hypothetical protein